jgi:hypothetical protein
MSTKQASAQDMESFDNIGKTFNKSAECRDKMFTLCESLNDMLAELDGECIDDASFVTASKRMYEEARNKVVACAWMLHRTSNDLSHIKIKALKQNVGYESDESDESETDSESEVHRVDTKYDTRLRNAEAKVQTARRDYDANFETMKRVDSQLTDDYKVYLLYIQTKLKALIDEKVAAVMN